VAVSFASFFSYQPFLFHRSMLPLPLLSLVMFIALAAVAYTVREALSQNESQVASS